MQVRVSGSIPRVDRHFVQDIMGPAGGRDVRCIEYYGWSCQLDGNGACMLMMEISLVLE